jgi:hypothetical protein
VLRRAENTRPAAVGLARADGLRRPLVEQGVEVVLAADGLYVVSYILAAKVDALQLPAHLADELDTTKEVELLVGVLG